MSKERFKKTDIGRIPSEWDVDTTSSFCLKVADGTHATPKPTTEGKFLVTSKNINDGSIDLESAYKISMEDFIEINRRSKVDQWDVLLSMIGTVGAPCLIDNIPDFAIKNVGLFKCGDEIRAKWLFYYLKSKTAQDYIRTRLSGTTQKYITLGQLRDFPVPNPGEDEMEEIVDIVSALYKKIQLLRNQNNLMLDIAEAIYKRWFFEYEFPDVKGNPYSSSRGKMVDSESGDIPEKWSVCKFGDILERLNDRIGRDDQSKYVVLSAVKTGDLVLSEEYFSKQVFSKDISKYIKLQKDDFAYNPARINIGSIGKLEDDIQGAVSPVYVAFRAKDHFTHFVSFLIKTQKTKKHIDYFANGSVRQSLSYDDFAFMDIVKPSEDVLKAFNETYECIAKRIQANNQQIDTLSKMLDTLMPKLLTGEIRVST